MAHILALDTRAVVGPRDWLPELDWRIENAIKFDGLLVEQQLEQLSRSVYTVDLGSKKRIPDVMGFQTGPFFVSKPIRDWIAERQPELPRFYAIRLGTTRPIDGAVEHAGFYVMSAWPRLEPMVIERTTWWQPGSRAISTAGPCAVYAEKIKGLHVWRNTEDNGDEYMCSDAFFDFFKSSKLLGWRSARHCEEM